MKSSSSESVYLERLSREIDFGANLADGFGSDVELSGRNFYKYRILTEMGISLRLNLIRLGLNKFSGS